MKLQLGNETGESRGRLAKSWLPSLHSTLSIIIRLISVSKCICDESGWGQEHPGLRLLMGGVATLLRLKRHYYLFKFFSPSTLPVKADVDEMESDKGSNLYSFWNYMLCLYI